MPAALTRRESEILAAVGEHLTNAEIAARCFVSVRTVESHVSAILRKVGESSRRELARRAPDLLGATPAQPSVPGPVELLADKETFVGRGHEQERLAELWRRAMQPQLMVALVTGEAGIGKSRLVAEFAVEASGEGRVVLGSCYAGTQAPFQPFAQVLVDDATQPGDPAWLDWIGAAGPTLARVAPELGRRLDLAEPGEDVDPLDEKAGALAELHGYFSRASRTRPLILIVEDVHWASRSTRDAVLHIARVGGRCPMLVIVTSRDTAPERDDALVTLFGELLRLANVEHIALGGLDEDAIGALLEGDVSGLDASRVLAETGGNALLVRERLRSGTSAGGPSIAALLGDRCARLDPSTVDVVNAAAVIGAEFDAGFLAACLDWGVSDVVSALEAGEAAGLVASTPGRPARFRFVHALFQAWLYESLPPHDRRRRHHQAFVALERRGDTDDVVADLARHARDAAPLTDARTAIDYSLRAGRLAEQALGFDEASSHYRVALGLLDLADEHDHHLRLDVTIRLGSALTHAGDPDGRLVLSDAGRLALRDGSGGQLVEIAEAMVQYGSSRRPGAVDPEFEAIAEQALERLGPEASAPRARILALLGSGIGAGRDSERGYELAREALAMARSLDDPVTLGHVLLANRFFGIEPGRPDQRRQVAEELIALGQQHHEPILVIIGTMTRAWSAREAGDLAGYGDDVDRVAAMLASRPVAYPRLTLGLQQATRQLLLGDLRCAEEAFGQLYAAAYDASTDPNGLVGPLLLAIRYAQGRLPEMIDVLETAVAANPGFTAAYEGCLAVAYGQADRVDDARRILRRWADAGFKGVQRNWVRPATIAYFCDAAEQTRDADAASQLVAHLQPLSGLLADFSVTVGMPIDLAISQASLTMGDVDGAAIAAEGAIAASRRRKTPVFLGRELVRLAECRRRQGAGSSEVRRLVDEARELASCTGAAIIGRDVEMYGLAG
ncbi:MAG: AAA family ATPase [Ilumatobacteraceae bacterium]|nr:MAG: AAA family ATPase [Actinomycetota bacterium]